MATISSPCFNCPKREVGCHSNCNDYLSFRETLDNHNTSIRELRQKHSQLVDATIKGIKRMKTKPKRKGYR